MKKYKRDTSHIIYQTRPGSPQYAEARSCFYRTKLRKDLLKTKFNCGTNEFGYAFIASFKEIRGRLIAVLTPGITTHDDDQKSFEFTPHTNLTSSLWLERKPIYHG